MRIISIAIGLACFSSAFAGEVRNGADFDPMSKYAWFSEDRPIGFCIEWHQDIGLDLATVRSKVLGALAIWRQYLLEHSIWQDPTQKQQFLTTNFIEGHDCAQADLIFKFGTPDRAVSEALVRRRAPHAWGIAEMQVRGPGAWSKGFVWIRSMGSTEERLIPNWQMFPDHLQSLLAHELGHVFGLPHVPDTIMDQDIAEKIRELQTKPSSLSKSSMRIDRVDGFRSLLIHGLDYRNQSGFFPDDASVSQPDESLFRELTGHHPNGAISAQADLRIDSRGASANGTLKLSDQASTYELPFTASMTSFFAFLDIFVVEDYGALVHGGSVFMGTLFLPSGERIPIQLDINGGHGERFKISSIRGHIAKKLFTAVDQIGPIP